MGSNEALDLVGSLVLVASLVVTAGSRRFLSRSFMNSSYLAVPGRGGASAGKPPAHCGMYSPIPSASFALIVPHPLKAKPAIKIATIVEIWRARFGIGKTLQR
jgi:hypothetical protein